MARVTIKELAKECGIAVSTASRAMNGRSDVSPATRELVLAVAQRMGYVPNVGAQSLKLEGTQAISVIIQGETSELLVKLLGELEQELASAGYEALLSHVPDEKATAATVQQIVSERKFLGVVFLGRYGNSGTREASILSNRLADLGVPIVFCTTADFSGSTYVQSSISVDDYTGCGELTKLLLSKGHRNIAFASVGHDDGLESGHAWALRYRGYRDAMEAAGIEITGRMLIPATSPASIYTMPGGYHSVSAWLQQGELGETTAIVCACDAVAIGAARALREAGLSIPDDVSITGFDGLDFARYTVPSIATIAQPLEKIAQETARVLIAAIDQEHRTSEQVWIKGQLLPGESIATRTPK